MICPTRIPSLGNSLILKAVSLTRGAKLTGSTISLLNIISTDTGR